MEICVWLVSSALIFQGPAATSGGPATIVQPGAPGQASKVLSEASARTVPRPPAEADVSFMQGMIMHHSQAVEMTKLLQTHSQNKDLQLLGKRISISQTDEMQFMKQWLEERGKPVSTAGAMTDNMSHDMSHMDSMKMGSMSMSMPMPMMMPGMLTPEQMNALGKARGKAFDHLFLTGMIQHHTGALVMVKELFETAGAGQDAVLFDFATDVDNTQRAEIGIMQGMLDKEKK